MLRLSGTEVDLTFGEIDFKDGDPELASGAVGFSGAAATKRALGGVEGEKIVLDGRDVD